jgi:hypothetical protein
MSQKKLALIIFISLAFLAVFAALLFFLVRHGFFDSNVNRPAAEPVLRRIFREFTLHEAPSFASAVLQTHQPRLVEILTDRDDGWVEVSFEGGVSAGWAFLPRLPVVNLPRPMGVFEDPRSREQGYIALVGPGDFEILEEAGNWLLIGTEDGLMWIDLSFWPDDSLFRDFFDNFPYAVSVWYHNLESGITFGHKDALVYYSASLNKASHALYVYHLAEQGLADLNRIHTLRPGERRFGTGVIHRAAAYGTEFSHLELLRHSVADSDNTAFNILLNHYYNYSPCFNEFYESIGGSMYFAGDNRNHSMTAAEAGFIMQNIHRYIQTNTDYARHFHHSLLHSDVPVIVSDYPVAQKYGHWQESFHDMAIVYSPSPYILVIMSALGYRAPFHAFEEISVFVQDFNDRYFGGVGVD